MDLILAVDVGTQSLKACVLDHDLNILEERKVSYFPNVKGKNRVEFQAEELWDAFVAALKELERGPEVEAVSFSTLCPSLLAMDGDGVPLGPVILHLDRRSYRQSVWALEQVGEERFLRTAGNLPYPGGISVTSLLWIREHAPEIYSRADVKFGHVVTFFMKRLCGRFAIDPSNASFTGIYDTVGYGDWDDELLRALDIPREKLPDVVMSRSVMGEIDRTVSASTGLRAGIPVIIGANDTTCATVGAGVTESGMLMNTSGTVEIMVLCLDRPYVSKNNLLRTAAYPGRWLSMRTVGAGGASIEWFRRNFCKELSREDFYNQYLPPVLNRERYPDERFLPFLSGDRHSIRQRRASFNGLTLNTDREDLLSALAYGIVEFQIEGLREWQKTVRLDTSIYHVGGGASKAYTDFKQRLLKDFSFVQLGETAVKGAAKLGFETLEGPANS